EVIEDAEKSDLLEYFAFREIALSLGRVSMLAALYVLLTVVNGSLLYLSGFTLIGLSVLPVIYFARKF
ncbi:MAG: hypothetical protein SV186_04700, partial [Candidatus Nanohaloarchaea archaeon]|nr:hypothetical protein [Candidatus Nanohaloarchaea archaeon]